MSRYAYERQALTAFGRAQPARVAGREVETEWPGARPSCPLWVWVSPVIGRCNRWLSPGA